MYLAGLCAFLPGYGDILRRGGDPEQYPGYPEGLRRQSFKVRCEAEWICGQLPDLRGTFPEKPDSKRVALSEKDRWNHSDRSYHSGGGSPLPL